MLTQKKKVLILLFSLIHAYSIHIVVVWSNTLWYGYSPLLSRYWI